MIMIWNDIFTYRNGNLYWKHSGPGRKMHKPVGGKMVNGYICVGVKGVKHYVHRIIWEMFNEPIPKGLTVDHRNHRVNDNRLENLRLATQSEQNYNTNLRKDNISGTKGVSWDKTRNKWQTYIHVNKKRIHLGYFDSLDEAVKVVNRERKKLHGSFTCQKNE